MNIFYVFTVFLMCFSDLRIDFSMGVIDAFLGITFPMVPTD